MGDEFLKRGSYRAALSCYEAALRLDPRSAEAHCSKGSALVYLGRDEEALRSYDESLRLDPRSAVAQANQRAHAGDAVLMSTACASFDMFDNYEHRARVFCAAVNDLATAMGLEMQGHV